jgi:STE24 endopeptidase
MNPSAVNDLEPPAHTAMLEGVALERARERERLRVISSIASLVLSIAVLVLFVMTGASAALRDALGGNGWGATLAFIVMFQLILTLIGFPLEVYFGYTQGKRFGLLKQNFAGWLTDQARELGVGLLISTVMFAALYWIFRTLPELWFPLSVALIAAFLTVILWLSPRLARLNYKASPLHNPDLEARVQEVFKRAGVRLTKVSQLEVGAKTKTMNAALIPDGTGTEVIVTDTLLERVAPEGVEVVLAHELGHRVHGDLRTLLLLSGAQFIATVAFAQLLFSAFGSSFGLQGAGDIATLPLLLLSFTLVSQIGSLAINAYKRRMEYRADAYALSVTKNPAAFEAAFRVLASENLADPDPPRWVEVWLHDHPSIDQRVARARAWQG